MKFSAVTSTAAFSSMIQLPGKLDLDLGSQSRGLAERGQEEEEENERH